MNRKWLLCALAASVFAVESTAQAYPTNPIRVLFTVSFGSDPDGSLLAATAALNQQERRQ